MKKTVFFVLSLLVGVSSLKAQVYSDEELSVLRADEVVYFRENLVITSAGLSSDPHTLVKMSSRKAEVSQGLNIGGAIEFEKGVTDQLSLTTGLNTSVREIAKVGEVDNVKLFLSRPIEVNDTIEALYGVITTPDNWVMTSSSTSLDKDTVLIFKSGALFSPPVDGYSGAIDGAVVIESIPMALGKFSLPFKKYSAGSQYQRRFFTIYKADGDADLGAKVAFFARNPRNESFGKSFEYGSTNEFWELEVSGSEISNITVETNIFRRRTTPDFVLDYICYLDIGSGSESWVCVEVDEISSGLDGTYVSSVSLVNFKKGYIVPASGVLEGGINPDFGGAYDIMTPNGDGQNDGFVINVEDGVTYSVEIYGVGNAGQIKLIYQSSDNYINGSWFGSCVNARFCPNGQVKQGSYYYVVKGSNGGVKKGWLRVQYRKK